MGDGVETLGAVLWLRWNGIIYMAWPSCFIYLFICFSNSLYNNDQIFFHMCFMSIELQRALSGGILRFEFPPMHCSGFDENGYENLWKRNIANHLFYSRSTACSIFTEEKKTDMKPETAGVHLKQSDIKHFITKWRQVSSSTQNNPTETLSWLWRLYLALRDRSMKSFDSLCHMGVRNHPNL